MDNKKIINMKYAVDETGKPVSATVIYDDNTWNNVIGNPQQVKKWAAQVASENPIDNISNIIYRVPSQDALRRALEVDLARVDENGNKMLGVGTTNDAVIEKVINRHKWRNRLLALAGVAAIGAGIKFAADNIEAKNVLATAKNTQDNELTSDEISDELEERLQMTDFQRDFLADAEATIDQYNSLCDKYELDESFKINLDEYLAAYLNYNDLSINETKELIPMLMNVDNAETMDVNYIQTCLQSINSKFLGMSVVMTDANDASVFDGFIQDVTGSLTEREADLQGLSGEEREKQLANLTKCRNIMRQMWTHFVESNNSGKLCDDSFYDFVSQSINEEVNGIPTGSAFYRMFADTYLTCGGIHSANYDEIINARTHEQRSFDDSTQENQNELSLSDNVVTHSNKVCGTIDERIKTAWNDAREWFKETYEMMEDEGLTTDVKYYVNSEYNEEYNQLREKYKDIELFNVDDDKKAALLSDLVNNYLHTHGRSWDGNLSNYSTSYSGGSGQTTTTTETWTEQIPEGQQPVISSKTEYNDQYDPSKPVLTQDQADDWIAQKEQQVAQGPTTVTNPDGSTTTTETIKNPDGSYTTKEETVGNPVIETPVDGDIKDEDGNIVISGNESEATNNPETDHVKDLIDQAQKEAQESQNQNQDVVSQPGNDSSSNPSTSNPVEENPAVEEKPSTPGDSSSSSEDNTDVTHEANTDGTSVDVSVGDFVPITDGAISEYDEKAVTNEMLESTIGTTENTQSIEEAPAPVVEESPAPVVEETPAPVVEEAPAPVVEEAPAPVVEVAPAPVVEEAPAPVVEVAPAPVVEEAPAAESSNVSITVGTDVVTFDTNGNISNVEPAPAIENSTENTKTL